MCLHGLDILSTWVLFLLPSVCDGFCVSVFSLGQGDLDVFVTNCMDIPRSCSAGVNEMRVFGNCLYSLCRPRFSGILGSLSKEFNSCVCFPFLVCTQTYLEVCIVEHIVARSVSSPEFSLLSASVLCGSLFLEPLFARVGNYLFFRVHGSTRFVGTSLCLTSSSLSIFATITERS